MTIRNHTGNRSLAAKSATPFSAPVWSAAMAAVVLLGDSIFDNGAYTQGEPDVVTHLGTVLPAGARAMLLAKDGAIAKVILRDHGL
jgi:hypothetical protein